MSGVLFDFARIVSGFGKSRVNPYVFLIDLNAIIDALLFFDCIITTESIKDYYLEWQTEPGIFDLEKPMYIDLFGSAITHYPTELLDGEVQRLKLQHGDNRITYNDHATYFYPADIAALRDLQKELSAPVNTFLLKTNTAPVHDIKILMTLDRVRTMLILAGVMKIPYNPVLHRQPMARFLYPGNIRMSQQFKDYRRFEYHLYKYLTDILREYVKLQIPLMFFYVLRECRADCPDDIFAVVSQLRRDDTVRSFREVYWNAISAFGEMNISRLPRYATLLKEELERLNKKFKVCETLDQSFIIKMLWFPPESMSTPSDFLATRRLFETYPALLQMTRINTQFLDHIFHASEKIEAVLGMKITCDDIKEVSAITPAILE